jgi:NDP-sugar pyrophosphorylase family protein
MNDMERKPFTITMRQDLLQKVDSLVDGTKIRNRSHAFENLVSTYFKPKVTKALILAGGKGAKMRPLTYELPKAMLPVKGRPILEYTIELLKKNDIREIYIAIGHLGQKIKDHFGDGSRFSVKINYIDEKRDLGTGGALKSALPYMGQENFVLLWGDVLIDLDLADLVDFHIQDNPIMTIALTSVDDPSEYGSVKLHRDMMVDFKEKPKKAADVSHLVTAGVHITNASIAKYFPKKSSFMLEADVLPRLIEEGEVRGYLFDGQWFDVGTADIYQRAIKQWKK